MKKIWILWKPTEFNGWYPEFIFNFDVRTVDWIKVYLDRGSKVTEAEVQTP